MKRQLALILAGALALSLVGCSNQGGGSAASQAGESSQASVASSDGSGETQEIGSGTMKLTLPEWQLCRACWMHLTNPIRGSASGRRQ